MTEGESRDFTFLLGERITVQRTTSSFCSSNLAPAPPDPGFSLFLQLSTHNLQLIFCSFLPPTRNPQPRPFIIPDPEQEHFRMTK